MVTNTPESHALRGALLDFPKGAVILSEGRKPEVEGSAPSKKRRILRLYFVPLRMTSIHRTFYPISFPANSFFNGTNSTPATASASTMQGSIYAPLYTSE